MLSIMVAASNTPVLAKALSERLQDIASSVSHSGSHAARLVRLPAPLE